MPAHVLLSDSSSARSPCSAPASWARRSPRISPTPTFPSSCSTSPRRRATRTASSARRSPGSRSSSPRRSPTADRAAYIDAANYDRDLARLADCDLVIEAIAERMDWKRDLYAKIAPHLAPHAIVASNTSGLSINALAEALPAAMRPRFCGIHFFNPPRYMHLVELIAQNATDPALLDALETFVVTTLGKGVVRAKDTPNFVANRVGIFSMLATMVHTETLRPRLRRRRRADRPGDRPREERDLPHRRRRRPRHDGARDQDDAGHAARRSVASAASGRRRCSRR